MHIGEEISQHAVGPVRIVNQSKSEKEGQDGDTCSSGGLLPNLQEKEKEKGTSKD